MESSPTGSHVDVNTNNTSLIQIKAASEDEVSRRIQAFIRNKRSEVDERNIREFICPLSSGSELDTSCARVEAVYIRREGQKSHITLKKVENSSGPQTLLPADDFDGSSRRPYRVPVDVQRGEAVEERLCNIETHLNMENNARDIYARIKALEERVSFLEGLSPEYFTDGLPRKKRKFQNSLADGGTIGDSKQAVTASLEGEGIRTTKAEFRLMSLNRQESQDQTRSSYQIGCMRWDEPACPEWDWFIANWTIVPDSDIIRKKIALLSVLHASDDYDGITIFVMYNLFHVTNAPHKNVNIVRYSSINQTIDNDEIL